MSEKNFVYLKVYLYNLFDCYSRFHSSKNKGKWLFILFLLVFIY